MKNKINNPPIEFYWKREWNSETIKIKGDEVEKIEILLYQDSYQHNKKILIKNLGILNIKRNQNYTLIIRKGNRND